jgi:hypothetical protein
MWYYLSMGHSPTIHRMGHTRARVWATRWSCYYTTHPCLFRRMRLTRNHLPTLALSEARELAADPGAKTQSIPQLHDSAGALPGIGNMASILNGIRQKTSINGSRTSNALTASSSALPKRGDRVGAPSRARYSAARGSSSVRAKEPVALENTRGRLTATSRIVSASRGAASAG